jgi:hypothetical protein
MNNQSFKEELLKHIKLIKPFRIEDRIIFLDLYNSNLELIKKYEQETYITLPIKNKIMIITIGINGYSIFPFHQDIQ